MKMNRVEQIEKVLDEMYPSAYCELNYEKDYELLLAVMLSAQTTDKRVNEVTKVLFKKYDSLEKLKDAPLEEIEKIIASIGTYHKKAKFVHDIASILVNDYDSKMPYKRKLLETFPGVGRKTVNVVLGELGIEPNIAVDTHVERVSKRLGLAKEKDSVLDVETKLRRKLKKQEWVKRHHQLIFFGRYHCKAMKPECDACKLKHLCKENNKKQSVMKRTLNRKHHKKEFLK